MDSRWYDGDGCRVVQVNSVDGNGRQHLSPAPGVGAMDGGGVDCWRLWFWVETEMWDFETRIWSLRRGC